MEPYPTHIPGVSGNKKSSIISHAQGGETLFECKVMNANGKVKKIITPKQMRARPVPKFNHFTPSKGD